MKTEWISKEQAAERLELSVRSVLAMAAAGKIQRKLEVDPENHQRTTRLLAADIERLAKERTEPIVRMPQSQDTADRPTVPATTREPNNLRALASLLGPLAAVTSTPSVPHWLTVDAAAERLGFSRATILRLIHAGQLPAIEDEPIRDEGQRAKAGSKWRICEQDLVTLRGIRQMKQEPELFKTA